MKRVTAAERRFAKRIIARAVAIVEREHRVFDNEKECWRLLVEASWKPKRTLRRRSA